MKAEEDLVLADALAALAHELRTPLTAIRGFADLLPSLNGPDDEAARTEITARLLRNTQHLEALVDNMLEAASHGGRESLHPRALSLRSLAREVVADIAGTLAGHPVVVHGAAADAYADPDAVTRVLVSLLTNAARYSPDGSMIDVETASGPDGHAVLAVSDSGPGIPDDERDAVFVRFWRGEGARHRVRGLGVGLSIARDLCELSGGDITLSATPSGGARFEVDLPAAP
jgi:two-component system sensor histidine kinase MprB